MRFEFILLTKTTGALNEVAFTYYKVRGLSFLAVVFVTAILRIISALRLVIQYQRLTLRRNKEQACLGSI